MQLKINNMLINLKLSSLLLFFIIIFEDLISMNKITLPDPTWYGNRFAMNIF